MNVLVRPEHSSDAAAIDHVLRSSFATDQEARLVDRLRNHQRLRLSLVAEIAGVIIGHIAFSEVTIAGSVASSAGVGLAPLAILPELQRRGLGSQLINEGLCACTRQGAGFVVVLGAPEYYHRFGFRSADLFGLKNEYGARDEFMALELKTGSITLVLSATRLSSRICPVRCEKARRAKLLDDASLTIRLPRVANPPSVNNQPVRKTSPLFSRQ